MKVKDILDKLKDLDPELEVTTAINEECCSGDFAFTYGLDPYFSVETLYEFGDLIYTSEEDLVDAMETQEAIDDIKNIPRSEKLVITVMP